MFPQDPHATIFVGTLASRLTIGSDKLILVVFYAQGRSGIIESCILTFFSSRSLAIIHLSLADTIPYLANIPCILTSTANKRHFDLWWVALPLRRFVWSILLFRRRRHSSTSWAIFGHLISFFLFRVCTPRPMAVLDRVCLEST